MPTIVNMIVWAALATTVAASAVPPASSSRVRAIELTPSTMLRHNQYCVPCDAICLQDDKVFAPICGTNNVTYSDECELRIHNCQSRENVRVALRGPCSLGLTGEQNKFRNQLNSDVTLEPIRQPANHIVDHRTQQTFYNVTTLALHAPNRLSPIYQPQTGWLSPNADANYDDNYEQDRDSDEQQQGYSYSQQRTRQHSNKQRQSPYRIVLNQPDFLATNHRMRQPNVRDFRINMLSSSSSSSLLNDNNWLLERKDTGNSTTEDKLQQKKHVKASSSGGGSNDNAAAQTNRRQRGAA